VCGTRRLLAIFALVAILAIAARSQQEKGDARPEAEEPIFWPDWKPVDAGTPLKLMFGRNQLVNGDAESGLNDHGPVWSSYGRVTTAAYGTAAGEPDAATAGPSDRGGHYFRCPVYGEGPRPGNTITQSVDVRAIAAIIDEGTVRYRVAGWFGGTGNADAYVRLVFRNGTGRELGLIQTDTVAKSQTRLATLTERLKLGQVPKGTRGIEVVVQFFSRGDEVGESVAVADNLSLVLTK
jgi:hypothetical protein